MKKPAASSISLNNGQITEGIGPAPITPNQELIYEVFRIEQGIPLFLDDHLARLNGSIEQTGHKPGIPMDTLKENLMQMIYRSKALTGNIRIEFGFEKPAPDPTFFRAFFIATNYPDNSMYDTGVVCNFLEATRLNPSVKMANPDLRHRSDQLIEKEQIYETILVNHEGFITEGSRSNLFFIRDNRIYTAPDHLVLKGIMRQKVLQVIRDQKIRVIMEAISKKDLHLFEGCFITGTSPRVLPVQRIDTLNFKNPNPLISDIRTGLNNLIANYIVNQK